MEVDDRRIGSWKLNLDGPKLGEGELNRQFLCEEGGITERQIIAPQTDWLLYHTK